MERTWISRLFMAGWLGCVALLGIPSAVAAADTKTAADVVPADCSMFSTSLRLAEQFEAFWKSKATQKLYNLPSVQAGIAQMKAMPQYDEFERGLKNPPVPEVLATLKDAVSTETFGYASREIIPWLGLVGEYQYQNMLNTIGSAMSGREPNPLPAIVEVLLKHKDLRLAPFVFGFKMSNKERVEKLLGQLTEVVNNAPLPAKMERISVGGDNYRTVQLSFDKLPIPEAEIIDGLTNNGVTPGKAEDFYAWMKEQTLAVSIGFHGDYLIVSIGANNDHLAKLGKSVLSDHPDFKPVLKHVAGRQPLLSIGYTSKELMQAQRFDAKSGMAALDNLLGQFGFFLPAGLAPRLSKDLRQMGKEIDANMPLLSEVIQVSVQNQGAESFNYVRGEVPGMEFGKPLRLLKHLGGNPWLAIAGSSKSGRQGYEGTVKWCKTLYSYFTDFGLPLIPEDAKEEFQKFERIILPLLQTVDSITREKLIPSTDANETAFVIDTRMRLPKIVDEVTFPRAMPFPEAALVCSLNDGELFKQAIVEYVKAGEDFIEKLADVVPEPIPAVKVPAPRKRAVGDAEMFFYDLPPQLDKNILPHAIVSKKLLILSYSPTQSTRMLSGGEAPNNPVIGLDKPSGMVMMLRMDPFWSAVREWVDFAATIPEIPLHPDNPESEMIRQHVDAGLEFLSSFKGVTTRVYTENGYTITHSWVQCVSE